MEKEYERDEKIYWRDSECRDRCEIERESECSGSVVVVVVVIGD